jgi:fatty acid desaturase
MPVLRDRRDCPGVGPTTWLLPLAALGAIAVLVARFVLGFEESPVLSVVIWGCVAIFVTHTALLIAHAFGWTVWDLLGRPPKRTTTAHDDEDRVF